MKKVLFILAAVLLTALFPTVAFAKTTSEEKIYYDAAIRMTKNERTDEYALDFYKRGYRAEEKVFKDTAKEITKGIKNDYEKAEAIFYWIVENVTYTYNRPSGLTGLEEYLYGDCTTYAFLMDTFCKAVGIPSKFIEGGADDGKGSAGAHAWNRVYVDGRWIHVDSTWGEFDLSIEDWSQTHMLGPSVILQDEEAYEGTLIFYDFENEIIIKEVKNFPLNGLVNSTYGLDINDLFLDKRLTKPFTLNTYKVNADYHIIYVKPSAKKTYTVKFNSNSGTAVKSVKATANKTITKPANPTRSGYKFVAWYKDAKLTVKWDFAKDKITKNTTLYAGWTKTYKVTFNSNKGTAVKAVTVSKNKLATQPTAPTRTGYKFAGWYKDVKLTQKWDFATAKVTANTTLYAKWTKK